MQLFRSIATVGLYTIGSRVFGFVRTVMTASFLGATGISDALEVAIKFPSFLRRLFAEGAMNAAFIPLFAGRLAEKGEKDAKSFAEEILALLVFVLLGLVILVEIFMPYVMDVFVPGFRATPERMQYAIEFSRITFPFIFFISLTALYGGILNSVDRFALVASSPMAGNMAIIAVVFCFAYQMPTPGHAFATGVLVCGVVQFLWVWIPSLRRGIGLKVRMPKITYRVHDFLKKFIPAAASSGVVQINIFIGMIISSFLPAGSVSYLAYADRLNQLPLSVVGTAIATALLPLMSKQIRLKDMQKAKESQRDAVEMALFLTLPATVGLIVLALPMVVALFQHKAFTAADSVATSYALMAYASGLPAYIMLKIFASVFFAHQDTRTPFVTAAIAVVIDVVLSIALIQVMGHVGIALATSLSAWVNALLMGSLLIKKGHFYVDERLKFTFSRFALVGLTTALFLKLLQVKIHPFFLESNFTLKVILLVGMVTSGLTLFFVLLKALKVVDFKDFSRKFKKA